MRRIYGAGFVACGTGGLLATPAHPHPSTHTPTRYASRPTVRAHTHDAEGGEEERAAREAPARAPAPAHPTHAPRTTTPPPRHDTPRRVGTPPPAKLTGPQLTSSQPRWRAPPHPHAFTTQHTHAFTPPPPAIPPHKCARIHAAKCHGIAGDSGGEFEFARPPVGRTPPAPPAANPYSFRILGIRIPLTVAYAWTRGPCGSSARGSRGKSKPSEIHRKPGLKKFSGSRAHVGPPLGCLCADLRCRGPRGREASSCA